MNKELQILSPAENVSMADEWFEIATRDHFWMQWRFNVIKNKLTPVIRPTSNLKFLEIGCGHGQFIEQCEDTFPASVDGCDLNLYALKQVRNVRGDIFVYNIFDQNERLKNKYDGVFLLDVIEHIDDDKTFVNAALAHVKPGGLVVVNVPALNMLFSDYDVAAGHKRRYSRSQIEDLFKASGIELLSVSYWGMLMLPIAIARKIYLKFVPKKNIINAGFKSNAITNTFFKLLMRTELFFFKNPFIGTSVIAIGRKA